MADQPAPIEPLPYQTAMVAYLKDEEPDLWKWFSSNQVQQEQTDAVRLELLKSTYRLERDAHGRLYTARPSLVQVLAYGPRRRPIARKERRSAVGASRQDGDIEGAEPGRERAWRVASRIEIAISQLMVDRW